MQAGTGFIAPCGMNCGICLAYLRKERKCPGCHGEDTSKSASCIKCVIKNCEMIRLSQSKFSAVPTRIDMDNLGGHCTGLMQAREVTGRDIPLMVLTEVPVYDLQHSAVHLDLSAPDELIASGNGYRVRCRYCFGVSRSGATTLGLGLHFWVLSLI